MLYKLYKFRKGMSNLWKWRNVIWNDRDWDYDYIVKILLFKLSLMQASTKDWSVANADRDAREMRIVINALERVSKGSCYETVLPAFVGEGDFSRGKLCDKAESDLYVYGMTVLKRKMRTWWD